ncbi:MAG: YggS family pyridoxal phosphate-dependent enzyme [Muribaculaceae bacterium]|nr:YggS family pyridoxal phosphate-dependent enzyme [Muribaculaceae bacterium]
MSDIASRLEQLRSEVPEGVEIVAVSKFHPVEALREAYDAGQRIFGESRVQELLAKIPEMPADVRWHFIGHLQTNKVKALIGHTALIESVDSEKLLDLIDAESRKAGVTTNVLMQLHVAREETKFGFTPVELMEYFLERRFEKLTNTHICGVMGMASNTDDMERVRADFHLIYDVFDSIRHNETLGLRGFDKVSMGMSGDWRIAVEEGSDLIRIGTFIFGERQY